MIARMLRMLSGRTVEAIIAIVLVLGCFLLVTALLTNLFPEGTFLGSLVSLMDNPSNQPATKLVVSLPGEIEDTEPMVATLQSISRSVKDKPPDGIAWSDSREGLLLHDRHAIQTARRSSARIVFDDRNSLTLGENSLVVIQRLRKTPSSGQQGASLVMLGGRLEGHLSSAPGDSLRLDVQTASAVSRILSGQPGKPASFSVQVNKDESSTISVLEGEAEVTGQGRSVRLKASQAVTVQLSMPPGAVVTLPGAPTLVEPAPATAYYYRNQSPEIHFRWTNEPDADSYRFILARDEGFNDVVATADSTGTEFVHGNLKDGSYYWKVNGVKAQAGGIPSDTGHFDLVQDREPPRLAVSLTEGIIESDAVIIRGETEPGSRLFIANNIVEPGADGRFEYDLKLQRGLNVVIVEAMDAAGNITYESQLISARY